ncbi:RND efflux system, outer membrane lipoprotein, NodT family [Gemmatirosa kalamazoonensis]|uniref:RND efflux system, outer membrane lipoprotein, NodT family n=1 Tax=Gemmatirosa kalamazoonensis TaxID=861299 RepID=W0RF93_9BACT|nr:efflux transporter outer membrane subunit [Gemmatirosa kalamazoonensis]AHG89466.1 RND efflux system, outer membrane lipoprotein, NodT family [Gemmatirosa kalamazoonensis]
MRALARGATLVVLAACAVGPGRVEPPVPTVAARADAATPSAMRRVLDSLARARAADAPAGADTTPVRVTPATAPPAWLDVLHDPALVRLVRDALAGNRDVRVAEARVREFRAQRGVARAALFPQLSANAATSTNQAAFGPAVVPYNAVRATADVQWELDFWGRRRRGVQAAGFDLLGSEEGARATALTLVSDVAATYLALRAADAGLAIAEQTLESRRNTLALARRRFEQGVISELDVRQFEAGVAAPAVRVADFARQRAEAEHQLSALLGRAPGPIERGCELDEIVRAAAVPDSIPGALIARRPDVLRAQRDVQAAAARAGAAAASRLPNVVIGGQYGTQRPSLAGVFGPKGEVYGLSLGLSVPLLDAGRAANVTNAARAEAEAAQRSYEQTVLVALREASDAVAGLRLLHDQLVAQQTQAQALRAALAIAQRRYASGISSYLEVLDAQRGLFDAQLGLLQVQRDYLTATVTLYRALGGSWSAE